MRPLIMCLFLCSIGCASWPYDDCAGAANAAGDAAVNVSKRVGDDALGAERTKRRDEIAGVGFAIVKPFCTLIARGPVEAVPSTP